MSFASDNFLSDLIILNYWAIHSVCISATGLLPYPSTEGNIIDITASGTLSFIFVLNSSLQAQKAWNNWQYYI